jgi:hypothetical protein
MPVSASMSGASSWHSCFVLFPLLLVTGKHRFVAAAARPREMHRSAPAPLKRGNLHPLISTMWAGQVNEVPVQIQGSCGSVRPVLYGAPLHVPRSN